MALLLCSPQRPFGNSLKSAGLGHPNPTQGSLMPGVFHSCPHSNPHVWTTKLTQEQRHPEETHQGTHAPGDAPEKGGRSCAVQSWGSRSHVLLLPSDSCPDHCLSTHITGTQVCYHAAEFLIVIHDAKQKRRNKNSVSYA